MLDTITGSPLTHFAGRAVSFGRVQPHASGSSRRGPLFLPMHPIAQFLDALRGKRTYLVCGAALIYLIACQFSGRAPSETILGIFASLGVATLRASIASGARSVPGVMLTLGLVTMLGTGCISGGAAKVGTTELLIQRGTNVYKLKNPKDTSIDKFRGNADGSFELIGYRSLVNEHLVRAAQFEAQALHDERKMGLDMFDRGVQAGATRWGVNMAPANPAPTNAPTILVPATLVLTNTPTAK